MRELVLLAERGSLVAMTFVAGCYSVGDVVPRDAALAEALFSGPSAFGQPAVGSTRPYRTLSTPRVPSMTYSGGKARRRSSVLVANGQDPGS